MTGLGTSAKALEFTQGFCVKAVSLAVVFVYAARAQTLYAVGGRTLTDSVTSLFSANCDAGSTILRERNFSNPLPFDSSFTAAAVLNSEIIVAGGYYGSMSTSASVWKYSCDGWRPLSSMNEPRSGLGLVSTMGNLYAVGGTNGEVVLASVERYDPAADFWQRVSSMPTARSNFGIHAAGHLIFVFGGCSAVNNSVWADIDSRACGAIASVEMYNITSNTWTQVTSLQVARGRLAVFVFDGQIVIFGGIDAVGVPTAVAECWTPELNQTLLCPDYIPARFPPMYDFAAGTTRAGMAYLFGGGFISNGGVTYPSSRYIRTKRSVQDLWFSDAGALLEYRSGSPAVLLEWNCSAMRRQCGACSNPCGASDVVCGTCSNDTEFCLSGSCHALTTGTTGSSGTSGSSGSTGTTAAFVLESTGFLTSAVLFATSAFRETTNSAPGSESTGAALTTFAASTAHVAVSASSAASASAGVLDGGDLSTSPQLTGGIVGAAVAAVVAGLIVAAVVLVRKRQRRRRRSEHAPDDDPGDDQLVLHDIGGNAAGHGGRAPIINNNNNNGGGGGGGGVGGEGGAAVRQEDKYVALNNSRPDSLAAAPAAAVVPLSPGSGGVAGTNFYIDYASLTVGEQLGTGAFGTAYMAKWRGTNVVVKQATVNDNVAAALFLKELRTMQTLRPHPNVVLLLGVCDNPLALVLEWVDGGSLDKLLLRTLAIEITPTIAIDLCIDIAAGMRHIHAENILHCDLSARNVLVSKRGATYIAKVADFGLSHTVSMETGTYVSALALKVPVRWAAPEVLSNQHEHTKAADVWSFGVLVWEIIERDEPYVELDTNQAVVRAVGAGKRLRKPSKHEYPRDLDLIMELCFKDNPRDRPTFVELHKLLSNIEVETADGKRVRRSGRTRAIQDDGTLGEDDYRRSSRGGGESESEETMTSMDDDSCAVVEHGTDDVYLERKLLQQAQRGLPPGRTRAAAALGPSSSSSSAAAPAAPSSSSAAAGGRRPSSSAPPPPAGARGLRTAAGGESAAARQQQQQQHGGARSGDDDEEEEQAGSYEFSFAESLADDSGLIDPAPEASNLYMSIDRVPQMLASSDSEVPPERQQPEAPLQRNQYMSPDGLTPRQSSSLGTVGHGSHRSSSQPASASVSQPSLLDDDDDQPPTSLNDVYASVDVLRAEMVEQQRQRSSSSFSTDGPAIGSSGGSISSNHHPAAAAAGSPVTASVSLPSLPRPSSSSSRADPRAAAANARRRTSVDVVDSRHGRGAAGRLAPPASDARRQSLSAVSSGPAARYEDASRGPVLAASASVSAPALNDSTSRLLRFSRSEGGPPDSPQL